jgi:phage shock protein A
MNEKRVNDMGLFEKSRSITDTDLRILVQDSGEPSEALRRHILSLEESQRQLKSSQGFLERQRLWLESCAERKLGMAEEWGRRAEAAAGQNRDDLARQALVRKKDLLRSMGEDRRQLEEILPQLGETERRLGEVRQKILKARSVRERLFGEGGALPGEEGPSLRANDAGEAAERKKEELAGPEQKEIEEELKNVKRRLDADK